MKHYVLNMIFLIMVCESIKGQVLDYGYINEGLIDILIENPTEENVALKDMMQEMMKYEFEKDVYFSPEIQVEVQKRPNSELRTYYTGKMSASYKVLKTENEVFYSIDSSQIVMYQDVKIKNIMDSLKINLERRESISEKEKYLDIDCSVLTLESPNKGGDMIIFLTKSIKAQVYGVELTSALTGYPIKTKVEISPGLFLIYGAKEIKTINSDNEIFNLDLSKIEKISDAEMSKRTGAGMRF